MDEVPLGLHKLVYHVEINHVWQVNCCEWLHQTLELLIKFLALVVREPLFNLFMMVLQQLI